MHRDIIYACQLLQTYSGFRSPLLNLDGQMALVFYPSFFTGTVHRHKNFFQDFQSAKLGRGLEKVLRTVHLKE